MCLCTTFVYLSALIGCCSSVSIRMIIYKFLNVCPFDYTDAAVMGKVCALVNRFNDTSGVTDVTPTDGPKSVQNRCVNKFVVLCICCRVFLIVMWV